MNLNSEFLSTSTNITRAQSHNLSYNQSCENPRNFPQIHDLICQIKVFLWQRTPKAMLLICLILEELKLWGKRSTHRTRPLLPLCLISPPSFHVVAADCSSFVCFLPHFDNPCHASHRLLWLSPPSPP
ncbi:hypothetical protein PAHAL_4G175200 [Panicum hallii]|uniref:Uncharacterized protein n=1 Tax=Panicum hallii TaxID=206008 RepID=A0A2S3HJA5_9POAL|nr:hypothetical protein PAHAL_4G175200 [Panicum hallii]